MSNCNTTTGKKVFYSVILKCFQNHGHLSKSQKQTNAFFQSEPEVLPCFELNYKFLEWHKKPQKMASKSSTKQDGEATTEEVPGSIVTYTEEEINIFKDDMSSEHTKKSASTFVLRLQSWYLEKHKTELNFNNISTTKVRNF